jgi:DNA polymerase (family 10)
MTMDAAAIARLLTELGQRTALRRGNPYRARAYARAADSLLAWPEPVDMLVAQDRLQEVPGVGEAIAGIIRTLHKTGTHPALEKLRKDVPAGVLDMLSLPGLRPEKVLKLHKELGIASIEELEQAGRDDRIKTTKGLGAALQSRVLQGIEISREGGGRRHIHRAAELLRSAEKSLRASRPGLKRIVAAGEFRRGCELVGELSLVAEAKDAKGGQEILKTANQLTIYLSDEPHFGASLLFATGSQKHLEGLRAFAAKKGLTLDVRGLRRANQAVPVPNEEDIYAALGLPFIAPELREGRGEIKAALKGTLPGLVMDKDIRGILHAHTDRSDGVNTLEQMAEATCRHGYAYFGVADHSRSAGYAGGLSLAEIGEQHAEVDRLNARYGPAFRIFKGIESDILPDGSLDYPEDVLARFDFVVASVHSRFRLDRGEQTARIIRAVSNPYTTILGHMTGRQLLRRPGYEVDVEDILKACARHGVAVEVNANPWRLDLDWRWHARALELGCMISINPDAHSISEIDLTHWGVELARKGGVPRERVLNCFDLKAFTRFLVDRRPKKRRARPRSRSSTAA